MVLVIAYVTTALLVFGGYHFFGGWFVGAAAAAAFGWQLIFWLRHRRFETTRDLINYWANRP